MILFFDLFVLLLVVLLAPVFSIRRVAKKLTGPTPLISRPTAGAAKSLHLPQEMDQLVAARGLAPVDTLQCGGIIFAIYGEPAGPPPERSAVVMWTKQRVVAEFVTHFSDELSLTTTRGNHAFAVPRHPGAYLQGFNHLTLEELWTKHLEAELFLRDQGNILTMARVLEPDRAVRIERALRKQGAHIKATPLFWLKAPYWFYVKRHLMVNKSVARQMGSRSISPV